MVPVVVTPPLDGATRDPQFKAENIKIRKQIQVYVMDNNRNWYHSQQKLFWSGRDPELQLSTQVLSS